MGGEAHYLPGRGLKTYRTVVQFFLGLVLGDFIIGVLWPVVGWMLDVNVYCFAQ